VIDVGYTSWAIRIVCEPIRQRPMTLMFSPHAARRMIDRGITVDEVEEVIARGIRLRNRERPGIRVRYLYGVTVVSDSDGTVRTVIAGMPGRARGRA
jgi:hypothetical protein